jgi:hypothetical protein
MTSVHQQSSMADIYLWQVVAGRLRQRSTLQHTTRIDGTRRIAPNFSISAALPTTSIHIHIHIIW